MKLIKMIIRYTQEEFNNAKCRDGLLCECEKCHKVYPMLKMHIIKKLPLNIKSYCSKECFDIARKRTMLINCDYCGKEFTRVPSEILKNSKQYCSHECCYKSKEKKINIVCAQCGNTFEKQESKTSHAKYNIKTRDFCCASCFGKYNMQHKKYGSSRSKFEKYVEQELIKTYPKLEVHYNRRDTINAELDIYIPSLNLAVEINGIFHYEPIYGAEQLKKVQNNDKRKFQACLEKNIEFCIIDVMSMRTFTLNKAIIYFDIIKRLVESKLILQQVS